MKTAKYRIIEMKTAKYRIIETGLCTVTIFVYDCDDVTQHTFTGFGLADAVRNANKRLNIFGYQL